eukprot:3687969-Prymnesium_polylepis.1
MNSQSTAGHECDEGGSGCRLARPPARRDLPRGSKLLRLWVPVAISRAKQLAHKAGASPQRVRWPCTAAPRQRAARRPRRETCTRSSATPSRHSSRSRATTSQPRSASRSTPSRASSKRSCRRRRSRRRGAATEEQIV